MPVILRQLSHSIQLVGNGTDSGGLGEPCASSPIGTLCKHPRFEVLQYKHRLTIHSTHELTIEPIEVLLNYTFTRKSAGGKNSVQAGLGGVSLPSTVKQTNGVLINLSNLVPVKIYDTGVAFGDNFGVARCKVAHVMNRVDHLCFDFPHLVGLRGMNVV
jgi:hypothetical protein